MDRLTLIEIIAEELTDDARLDDSPVGPLAGRIADAIIVRAGSLRSLSALADEPEGGTMPPGPWTGSP